MKGRKDLDTHGRFKGEWVKALFSTKSTLKVNNTYELMT